MPKKIAQATSASVAGLNRHMAGRCIRFATDSPYVAVRATSLNAGGTDHMAMTGIAGCDVYSGADFLGTIRSKNMSGETYKTLLERPQPTTGTPPNQEFESQSSHRSHEHDVVDFYGFSAAVEHQPEFVIIEINLAQEAIDNGAVVKRIIELYTERCFLYNFLFPTRIAGG